MAAVATMSATHFDLPSSPESGLKSAAGVLGFLYDTETELKVFALETLNEEIDTVWTEVAGEVAQMCVFSR